MTNEEIVRILTLHNGCLSAQENGECRYNLIGRCEPCRYFTDDEEFAEAESAAIEALKERKTGKNVGTDYDEVDQFVCSECGIELQDWHSVERCEDGEVIFHEYTFRYCPHCGTKIEVDE